jgi:endonuclease YncB( thermonuclease family)
MTLRQARMTSIGFVASLLACSLAQAADLSGVARIIDGDTLAIGATKVRLEGELAALRSRSRSWWRRLGR